MDKRLTLKLTTYVCKFKDDIKAELLKMEFDKDKMSELLNYLYEYEQMPINKADFLKRKRVKNAIPNKNRCNAKKAGGDQCTRRRKDNCLYCGTHIKGAPHGEVTEIVENNNKKTIDINAIHINGIIYYIDNTENVYKMEDILSDAENPMVIGSYKTVNNDIVVSVSI